MATPCCGQTYEKSFKWGDEPFFTCLNGSCEQRLQMGFLYPCNSPVVAGPTPNDPLRPMTDKTETIIAWIGPHCTYDATEWTEDMWIHVYPNAVAIKNRVVWPAATDGTSLFSVEDIDDIVHSHPCMFDRLQECETAPAWLIGQETTDLS